jgi:NADH-quinone oxidoreductase subunit N
VENSALTPVLLNPAFLQLPAHQLALLMPYLIVFGGICLAVIVSVIPALQPRWSVPGLIIATLLAGIASSIQCAQAAPELLFSGMLLSDSLSHYANVLFLGAAILVCLFSFRYLERQALALPEYYLLLAFSALGMMLMASSLNLIIIFIALELMSLSVYILVGFRRNDRRSNEAAVKYYILGSAASAVMLYGAALLYGATLSIDIREITERVSQSGQIFNPMLLIGLLCVMVGFLFKIASVPFHMWMPDVYEGAPTPITGFMTTGLKAAVFVTFVRILSSLAGAPVFTTNVAMSFHNILWISALLTMFIGNVVALQQTNVKRMLAYSSIAHTGYLLVGLVAGPTNPEAFTAVLFYVLVYAVMNLGAFAVLSVLSQQGDTGLELGDLSGLSQKHPWLALSLAVFMFSMAGLPPTAGFTSKYNLLYSAIGAGEIWLVVLAVLCSAIAVYYYLRVLVFMYMRDPVTQAATAPIRTSKGATIALAVTLALVLQMGLMPSSTLSLVGGLLKSKPAATAAALP